MARHPDGGRLLGKTVGQVKDYIIDGWQPAKEFWED